MKLESYIKVYDNVISPKIISSIIKYSMTQDFKEAGVGNNNNINKNKRDVKAYSLMDWECGSKTKIHWCNYLLSVIRNYYNSYEKEFANSYGTCLNSIRTLEVLKYEVGGHYKPHVDHFEGFPRVLSAILLLNDDYEGGELEFSDPTTSKLSVRIESQSGRLIIWPSCFLYPHGVKPITKGTRYSIVSWAS